MKCKDCAHVEVCAEYAEGLFNARGVTLNLEQIASLLECDDCEHFKARSQSFTIEGYYLMYNEERLYTLEKDGIVILVQGSSPNDVVEKAKLAIEKLSKERESNA